mgnify:CR=1 FL=1
MAQGSRQIQSQAQQQVQTLSPQQILVVKLLELPAVELEDRIHAELLENPALEEGKEENVADEYSDGDTSGEGMENDANEYDSLSDYPTANCKRTADPKTSRRKIFRSPTLPLFMKY